MKATIVSAAILILSLAMLGGPPGALAGSFKAIPVKFFLDAKTKTTVLKVTNEGDEDVNVELEAFVWTMDENGADVYAPTKDLVLFPRQASIAKKSERVFRIGYEGERTLSTEKTYRIFVQEMPVSKPGEMAVKFAMRMGLPVFIKPVRAIQEGAIEKMSLSEGTVKVKVKNSGNSHFIVTKLKAAGVDRTGGASFTSENAGWYVLAGAARTFPVDVSRADCLKSSVINVEATAGDSVTRGSLNVDKGMCQDKPKQEKPKMDNKQPGAGQ
ncbi:MAG: molecular chaperone [Deltaproteobacteria bacterium]|nr:molecular chaperone [Deltaproteobacteria bacterium]